MNLEAGIAEVINRITKRVRDSEAAKYLIEKVKKFTQTHNPDDDLNREEVALLYRGDDFGDDFDIGKHELDIRWTNHAEYRSELRDVDSSKVNEGVRDFVEGHPSHEHRKVNLVKPFGRAVVDVNTQVEPEEAEVITVMAGEAIKLKVDREEKENNDRANEAFREILSKLTHLGGPFYMMDFGKKGLVTLEIKPSWGSLRLSFITVPLEYRNKGLASRAMRILTDIADKHGAEMTLEADPQGEGGLTKAQLFRWYKKNGFKRIPYDLEPDKLSDGMVRKPREARIAEMIVAGCVSDKGRREVNEIQELLPMTEPFTTTAGITTPSSSRQRFKDVEMTSPGSKNKYKITYQNGKQKWTDDYPADGKGGRRDNRKKERKLKRPAITEALEKLDGTVRSVAKGGSAYEALGKAVDDLIVHFDREETKEAIRKYVKEHTGEEGLKETIEALRKESDQRFRRDVKAGRMTMANDTILTLRNILNRVPAIKRVNVTGDEVEVLGVNGRSVYFYVKGPIVTWEAYENDGGKHSNGLEDTESDLAWKEKLKRTMEKIFTDGEMTASREEKIAAKLEAGWMNDTFRTLKSLGQHMGVDQILVTGIDEMKMVGEEGREMHFNLNFNMLRWEVWMNGKKISSGTENVENGNSWTGLIRNMKTMLAL